MDAQSCDVNVLGDALDKSLNIQGAHETESASDRHEEEEDLCEQVKTCQATSSKKRLNKCITFPYSNMMLPASSSDEEDEETETVSQGLFSKGSKDQAYSQSMPLPIPLKLVSAMKGSREKQGVLRDKLTVKWAPDVYDPTPTSISHSVKGKSSQKSKNKKNEKRNGKKGRNSSQGGSGKDKKQSRKSAKISDKFGNFEVGSSNSYCGSSFRQKSRTEVHYSTAEAS